MGSAYPLIPSEVQAAISALQSITGASWTFESQQGLSSGIQPIILDNDPTSMCGSPDYFPVPTSTFCEPVCSNWVDIGAASSLDTSSTTIEGLSTCMALPKLTASNPHD